MKSRAGAGGAQAAAWQVYLSAAAEATRTQRSRATSSSAQSRYHAMATILQSSAAPDTWRRRLAQTVRWTDDDALDQLETVISSRREEVSAGTVRKDISGLRWSLERQLSGDMAAPWSALLSDLQAGLRRVAATTPEKKAIPIMLAELRRAIAGQDTSVRLLAIITYRTASRVGDFLFLGPTNFRIVNATVLFISFSITKTNQENESRVDHQVEVQDAAEIIRLLRTMRTSRVTHPTLKVELEVYFTDAHRTKLQKCLAAWPVTPAKRRQWQQLRPANPLMTHYSLHSLKRGAAHRLWTAAAKGEIPHTTVMTMLKHKDVDTTLGYAPDPRLVAQAMGTPLASLITRQ
ncbi:MAG: hypothetical protein Q9Q40_03650 [Acidobacteriota bacterium]|nr:hypothetical protein [Acidobacteriota bacterium]